MTIVTENFREAFVPLEDNRAFVKEMRLLLKHPRNRKISKVGLDMVDIVT